MATIIAGFVAVANTNLNPAFDYPFNRALRTTRNLGALIAAMCYDLARIRDLNMSARLFFERVQYREHQPERSSKPNADTGLLAGVGSGG